MSGVAKGILKFAVLCLVVIGLTVAAYAGTSEDKARHVAEDIGYTNVTVTDKSIAWSYLSGCAADDDAIFTVSGIDPRGVQHTINVCAGVFTGGTLRSN